MSSRSKLPPSETSNGCNCMRCNTSVPSLYHHRTTTLPPRYHHYGFRSANGLQLSFRRCGRRARPIRKHGKHVTELGGPLRPDRFRFASSHGLCVSQPQSLCVVASVSECRSLCYCVSQPQFRCLVASVCVSRSRSLCVL